MGKSKPRKKKGQQEEEPPPALPEPVVIPSTDFPEIVEPAPITTLEPLQLTSDDRHRFSKLKRPEARCCLPRFVTAPDEALVYFDYLSEGGANVIFKIHPWPYAPAEQGQPFLFVDVKTGNMNSNPIHHAELANKVLRVNKGLLKTLRCEEVIAGFYGHVRPLFMPGGSIRIIGGHSTITSVGGPQFDFTRYLMDHRGVILYSGVMVDLISKCDTIGVERGQGSAQRLLTSPRWCILLPDMSPKPGSQVTIELKPKWLVQSPNAPENAIRCRTCALQVLKPKDPTKYLCPLKLLDNADFDAVLKWVFTRVVEQAAAHTQDPALNNAIAWQLAEYLYQGQGKVILEHLRVLQNHLDYHGILRRKWIGNRKKELYGLFEHNLRLAMTLRDCSLYIRVGYSKDGVDPKSIDCKLGDLDFKSADKMDDWFAKETELLESESYTQEIEDGPDCFHVRSSFVAPDLEQMIDYATVT
jgi:inositol-pentakisphosphate 2-kinase